MKPTITLCASVSHYHKLLMVASELEKAGMSVLVPDLARTMEEKGDFDVAHYKVWSTDPTQYAKKTAFMREHFEKVAQARAVLVTNFEKNGLEGYIGGNVLMELGLALYLKKKIFILNAIDEQIQFREEIFAMQPIFLEGDPLKIQQYL